MAQWSVRDVDAAWSDYVSAIEELAATSACDVLAHPDLVKAAGHEPVAPEECWDRLVEAARELGNGRRAVVGGMAQARQRGLSGAGLAGALRGERRPPHDGFRCPSPS